MKITFVLPDAGIAGGVRVIAIHAQRLREMGHDVAVICARYRYPTRRKRAMFNLRWAARRALGQRPPSHLRGLDIELREIKHPPPLTDADVPDADVVVATWWETAEWVAGFSPSKGAKAYFIQGYEVSAGQPADRLDATWKLPMRKIVIANWLADLAAERFGDRDVSIVPNAVDAVQFRAEPRGKQPAPTVGFMYSSKPIKGCDVCIEAIERARRSVCNLQVNVFGAGKPGNDLPPAYAFIRQPAQEELREIYASCDAWLFGSRTEGFGLPVLEAMACRTPVIATPAGAAPDLLADGGGMLVGAEDAAGMAQAIERIAGMSEADWRKMSKEAHEIATRYSWKDATRRFETALKDAIGRAPAEDLRSAGA
jgi:glycosyltransferase involved in cell wall biosynthesis